MIVTPSKLNRQAELYHQLGSMLSAGVPLLKALEMASANPALRGSRAVFQELIQHLSAGFTFTESMNKVHSGMPEFDISLLSAGEQSGRLDACFKTLSTYYSLRASIIRDTVSGLATTAATFHVFLLIFPLSLLVLFAQGIFNSQFILCIPFLIEKAVVFGALYGGVFLLIYASQGGRGEPWRAFVESITRRIPILSTARKSLALSRLSAALEALTNAGVSLPEGWEMAGAASGSPQLRKEISEWKPQMERGATPGELVNQATCFPQMFSNLYNTAEVSGQIDETLGRLREYYQEEGFRALRLFTRVMNGVLYGLLVLVVVYHVFSFYIGMYKSSLQQF